MDELTEVLACCQGDRLPTGRNIGLITGSGGQAELILDVAAATGVSLPPLSEEGRREAGRVIGPITGDGNPLDAWGTGKYDVNMPHGLKVLADEPNIHSIVMVSDTRDDSPMVPTQYTPYLAEAAKSCDKPCFFMNTRPGLFRQEFADSLRSSGIATIGGTRQGLGAIDRLARWSEPLAAPRPDQTATGRIAALLAGSDRDRASLNEIDAKSLLGEAGLPVVRERIISGPDEAGGSGGNHRLSSGTQNRLRRDPAQIRSWAGCGGAGGRTVADARRRRHGAQGGRPVTATFRCRLCGPADGA